MKTIAILTLASTAVTFAAGDTTALAQGLDRKLRTDAQVQSTQNDADVNRKCHKRFDGYIDTLKAGKYKDSEFFKCFRTSDQIFEYVNKLVELNPTLLTKEAISTTVQGKTIYAYKLTSGASKPQSLYYQSLAHAREWVAGSSNLYALSAILDDIVEKKHTAAELFNLYFVPIVNIDGYDISWTRGKRLQRKNANEVDLNRNWPARFDHPKEDKVSSSPRFPGSGELSEPETKGIDNWLKNKSSELAGWVDVHSYAGKILYPNGDTEELIGNDDDQNFKVLGDNVASAAGRKYNGQTAGSFGVAIGAFDDYIYRTYQKPVLTIEVAGSEFVVPTWTIRTRGEEIYRALTQFAKEITPFKDGSGGHKDGSGGNKDGSGGNALKDNTFKGNALKDNTFKGNALKDNTFKGNGHKDNTFKGNGHKDNTFKGNGHKDNDFKGNGHKDNAFKGNGHKDNAFKGNGHKDNTFKGNGGGILFPDEVEALKRKALKDNALKDNKDGSGGNALKDNTFKGNGGGILFPDEVEALKRKALKDNALKGNDWKGNNWNGNNWKGNNWNGNNWNGNNWKGNNWKGNDLKRNSLKGNRGGIQ